MTLQRISPAPPVQKTPAATPDRDRLREQTVGLTFRRALERAALRSPGGNEVTWAPLSKQELLEIVNAVSAQMNARLMRAMSMESREDLLPVLPFSPNRFLPPDGSLPPPPHGPPSRASIPHERQIPSASISHERRIPLMIRDGADALPLSAPERFVPLHGPPEEESSMRLPPKQDHDRAKRGGADLDSIISAAAAAHGVDPALVKSVIRVESNFNPNSTSPKGAMGLMQLMPKTARELGVQNAYDPAENVQAGTRYLGMLLNRYEGNVTMALAAYNWGMGNLERRPERMPLETQNYIENVTRRYERNRA